MVLEANIRIRRAPRRSERISPDRLHLDTSKEFRQAVSMGGIDTWMRAKKHGLVARRSEVPGRLDIGGAAAPSD